MEGYAELFPDSHRVLTALREMPRFFQSPTKGFVELTGPGRAAARALLRSPEPGQPGKLSVELEQFLVRVLDSVALAKFSSGLKAELTFADACRFWGIGDAEKDVEGRMSRYGDLAGAAGLAIGTDGLELTGGWFVGPEEFSELARLNDYLMGKFSRHLNLLKNRKGVERA